MFRNRKNSFFDVKCQEINSISAIFSIKIVTFNTNFDTFVKLSGTFVNKTATFKVKSVTFVKQSGTFTIEYGTFTIKSGTFNDDYLVSPIIYRIFLFLDNFTNGLKVNFFSHGN